EWAPEEPFLECEPGDVQIEGMPAAEIWRGRRSRWGHAPRPEGAVFDPGTGSWVSSPPALRYFVARCVADGPTCYWPAVLLACRGEHCDAVADNGAEEGTIDCANY